MSLAPSQSISSSSSPGVPPPALEIRLATDPEAPEPPERTVETVSVELTLLLVGLPPNPALVEPVGEVGDANGMGTARGIIGEVGSMLAGNEDMGGNPIPEPGDIGNPGENCEEIVVLGVSGVVGVRGVRGAVGGNMGGTGTSALESSDSPYSSFFSVPSSSSLSSSLLHSPPSPMPIPASKLSPMPTSPSEAIDMREVSTMEEGSS